MSTFWSLASAQVGTGMLETDFHVGRILNNVFLAPLIPDRSMMLQKIAVGGATD